MERSRAQRKQHEREPISPSLLSKGQGQRPINSIQQLAVSRF